MTAGAAKSIAPTAALSVPQLAERWAVDVHKILAWIRKGELRAFNVATVTSGRPRFRISYDAVLAFEAARSAMPTPKPARRKKQPELIEFF